VYKIEDTFPQIFRGLELLVVHIVAKSGHAPLQEKIIQHNRLMIII
jgi:hypothetical protein